LSPDFSIAETEAFREKIDSQDFKHLKNKINTYIYPSLKKNPFFGNNIKKLKGGFEGIYRYRIGAYRLFYTIEKDKLIVVAIDIVKRKDAYK
jgi:mRNA interferase RelE/StbE